MSEIFEFVKADANKAILKVKELDNLTIAEHPYVNAKMDYITITRGKRHTMTVINKDGSTWSVNWGEGGVTLCSDSVDNLKWAARDFFQKECKILLDLTVDSDKIEAAKVFYNSYFRSWQINFETRGREQNIWVDATDENEAMKIANEYIGDHNWHYQRAQTGIDMWVAEFPLDGPNLCEHCENCSGYYSHSGYYCNRFGTYYHPNGCIECEYYK